MRDNIKEMKLKLTTYDGRKFSVEMDGEKGELITDKEDFNSHEEILNLIQVMNFILVSHVEECEVMDERKEIMERYANLSYFTLKMGKKHLKEEDNVVDLSGVSK